MIKKSYFLPLFAALALAGCSQTDTPEMPESTDNGFIAVNIVQSNENGSRGAASNTFEEGTSDENYAETGLFFIFNTDGTLNGTAQNVALTPATGTSATPAVEKIYNAVLLINGAKDKPTDLQIVCVLNAPSGLAAGVDNISKLSDKIDDYATGFTSKGKFLMSNSIYEKDAEGKAIIGTAINDENIKLSASEALANPVEIYVERVVAKMNVSVATKFDNKGASPYIDGVETQLDIVITGMEIANIANKSYLFKNVDNIDAAWTWVWDTDNRRSYWETVALTASTPPVFDETDKGDYYNQSYTQIAGDDNFNLTEAKIENLYIQPNTSAQKTSVLVTAELRKHGESTGLDFVYYKGYFSPAKALNVIATEIAGLGYWKLVKADDESTEYTTLPPTDFEWKNNIDLGESNKIDDLEDYEVVACVKEGTGDLYQKVGDEYTPVDAATINSVLQEKHARYYNGGKCYYFVEIDQTPAAIDNGYVLPTFSTDDPEADAKLKEAHFYGVVRNHIYNLTLNSIAGLGTPVFDPDDVIIPTTPDDEKLYYLAARVQVLKWKVVGQTVDFNGLQ